MAVRKNAVNLTGSERQELTDAFKALKANGRYDLYVIRHAEAPMPNIHRGPSFLAWHRQFIFELEQELQQAAGNNDLGLPYWHWGENAAHADPKTYCVWDDDLMGGNGDPNDNFIVKTGPFRQGEWTIINTLGNLAGPLIREFGVSAPNLSTQNDINAALTTTPYDSVPFNTSANPSFRNKLEGWLGNPPELHNLGHVWIGGSMSPMTSPNDPIFFLNHCMVDNLWADWMVKNPTADMYLPVNGAAQGQNLNDIMEPTVNNSNVKNSDVLDHAAMGYSYDNTPGNCDEGTTTPPDEGTTTPPDEGTTTPPDEGTTTPPDDTTTTPPDEGTTTPPDEGTTTPPDDDNTTSPRSGWK